nr:hypothetical protein [Tanacetum cinerariifolium]
MTGNLSSPSKNMYSRWGGKRGIECIFVGYVEHSKAFRFFAVPRPSCRIPNETKDIGGSVIFEEVTKEVVVQQPDLELRKSKRTRTPKNFRPEFELYLIDGTRDKREKDEVGEMWFGGVRVQDCRMVVKEIEDRLLEKMKFGWSFKKDIDGESKDGIEKKLVMVNKE